ncbi:MAG TPA: ATP-binding cassette domain-containing protein, partial [Beijerinckiaceae bacterium]
AGAGKSVLVRALSGLWPWGAGAILWPSGRSIAFVSGPPFLAAGALREALTYPGPADGGRDDDLRAALTACGLAPLAARLDAVARWDQALSASERQRLAVARLLVQRPDIVILEDALSALDDAAQGDLLDTLFAACAASTILVVGGRAALAARVDRHLVMHRVGEGGAHLLEADDPLARPHLSVIAGSYARRDTGAA